MEPVFNRIKEQSVDREIAPARVGHRVAKRDPARMTAVAVIRFGPESGGLKLFSLFNHEHDAEFAPDRDGVWKERLDLLRSCRGSDVVVLRFLAQQLVAHAAADEIGLVPRRLQSAHDFHGSCAHRRKLITNRQNWSC